MWRRLQRDQIERSAERMPKEVFVLADSSDDRDDELEDETLEEMDDEEALFEHESTSDEVGDEVASESADGQAEGASTTAESEGVEGEVVESAEVAEAEDVMDEEEEEEGEEVELSWAQEKYMDLKQSVGVVVDRVPGPRVASSNVPWLIAVPLSYLAITLLISVAKVIKKNNTPRAHRKRQVNRNFELVELISKYLEEDKSQLDPKGFRALQSNFKFSPHEILRKYIRYALNEKPFDPEMVSNLLLLRKSSGLSDKDMIGVLNDIASKVVRAKGPVMMDTRGMTEKGIKKKAAVQAIFTKLLYLSELDEFLSPEARKVPERMPPPRTAAPPPPAKDEPLVFRPEMLKQQATGPTQAEIDAEQNQYLRVKEIFGLTDEDADRIRIDTLSESDVVRLEALLGRSPSGAGAAETSSDEEDAEEGEREERDEDS
ncbi:hypothetical protein KFL_002010210 [Klebsormidium nitens]|uniref:Armadillo-like repeats domain-containing protein n=1 Tax=Klebsormidium nitens TaxID=105231 RepID=A0A0U9HK46_KLENI|nr:hypothetical protein KFL_002010210 [Klebsormidium nitens]|eukprot:GAQ84705.1 hypothetical protein KFL_002010210 [Klebsormidium nitens]